MNDILILNAPPLSGKDQIAKYLVDNHGAYHMEVKEMLFEVAVRTAGISRSLWNALYERDFKEVPCPYLIVKGKQVSPREWMIHCSENVIKPMFGKDAFGKAAANKIKELQKDGTIKPYQLIVFSDGGFIEELEPISQTTTLPSDDFFLARITRPGYDWGNDSRSYVYLGTMAGNERDFTNEEGKMDQCAEEILKWVKGAQPHDAI